MPRSPFRVEAIDDEFDDDPSDTCADCGAGFEEEHADNCGYAGDEDDFDDPDPDADLQGLNS